MFTFFHKVASLVVTAHYNTSVSEEISVFTAWATGVLCIDADNKVPDNAEVRDNKRRDFRRRKFAMHESHYRGKEYNC